MSYWANAADTGTNHHFADIVSFKAQVSKIMVNFSVSGKWTCANHSLPSLLLVIEAAKTSSKVCQLQHDKNFSWKTAHEKDADSSIDCFLKVLSTGVWDILLTEALDHSPIVIFKGKT